MRTDAIFPDGMAEPSEPEGEDNILTCSSRWGTRTDPIFPDGMVEPRE